MKYIKAVILTVLMILAGETAQAQDDNTFELNETYPMVQGGTLHLSSDDAEVTIQGTDRPDVHVVIYRHVEVDGLNISKSGTFDVEVEQREGDLYITEKSDEQYRVVVGRVEEEYQITIQAPRDIALSIIGDDDRYTIRNIDRSISLEADDTAAKIINAGGQQFDFSMDDGRIAMDQGSGELRLSMDDGTFRAGKAAFSSWETEMDDGTIELGTDLVDSGTYTLSMDDGTLDLHVVDGGGRFMINHDDPGIELEGHFEVIRTREDYSEYRLPGGNAEVEINTDDGAITLSTR